MKKVLIIRPDGIGDFVIFSAVLEEYAKIFSGHQIDILCNPSTKDFVVPIPFISNVFTFDVRCLFRKKFLFNTFIFWIWSLFTRYDILIYPVYSRTCNGDQAAKWIKAKEKIAFDGDDSLAPLVERTKRNKYFTKIIISKRGPINEIERNLEFVKALGSQLRADELITKLWFNNFDADDSNQILQNNGLILKEYICIFPGANFTQKYWVVNKWGDLINKILKHYPKKRIVLLGGVSDKQINSEIQKLIVDKGTCTNLCGQLNLRVLAKVIESANLLISLDSAAVHIAAAVKTPNLCIMGGGHFERFYPYGDMLRNKIVYKKMDCFGCNWKCVFEYPKCIIDISVTEVYGLIEGILHYGR